MDQWLSNLSESSGLHRHRSIECFSVDCQGNDRFRSLCAITVNECCAIARSLRSHGIEIGREERDRENERERERGLAVKGRG